MAPRARWRRLLLLLAAAALAVAQESSGRSRRAPRDTPASHMVCMTFGDTHVIPFGGGDMYDVFSERPFVVARFAPKGRRELAFEVQATQRRGVWGDATVDQDFAVRCGLDTLLVRQSRGGRRPVVAMNGKPLALSAGPQEAFPSAPRGGGRYTIRDASDTGWDTFEIDCGFGAPSRGYASGFRLVLTWYRNASASGVYGNSRLLASPRYAGRLEAGACGWLASGIDARTLPHAVSPAASLFALLPQEHAQETVSGRSLPQPTPATLGPAKERCRIMVRDATGVDPFIPPPRFAALDRGIAATLNALVRGCALDELYGGAHKPWEMRELVCGWTRDAAVAAQAALNMLGRRLEACRQPLPPAGAYAALAEELFDLQRMCAAGSSSQPQRPRPPQLPDCSDPRQEAAAKQRAAAEAAKQAAQDKSERARVEALERQRAPQERAEHKEKQEAIRQKAAQLKQRRAEAAATAAFAKQQQRAASEREAERQRVLNQAVSAARQRAAAMIAAARAEANELVRRAHAEAFRLSAPAAPQVYTMLPRQAELYEPGKHSPNARRGERVMFESSEDSGEGSSARSSGAAR
jgi:hypothetical protein